MIFGQASDPNVDVIDRPVCRGHPAPDEERSGRGKDEPRVENEDREDWQRRGFESRPPPRPSAPPPPAEPKGKSAKAKRRDQLTLGQPIALLLGLSTLAEAGYRRSGVPSDRRSRNSALPDAEPTKEAVLEYLSQSLAKWQLPDDVVFVDSLPMGATGKVQKTKLREEYADR